MLGSPFEFKGRSVNEGVPATGNLGGKEMTRLNSTSLFLFEL